VPRKIIGEPASGKFYRSGPHAAIATNHSCRMAGLPNGSTVGACLEASLLRKAAAGSEAALRMVSEWTAKPEVTEGEFCPTCGKKPPVTFVHRYEQPESKNEPPKESELIELLLNYVPPKIARPNACRQAEMTVGTPEYLWHGNDPRVTRKAPELVSQMCFGIISWLRGDEAYQEFLNMMAKEHPDV
jgi:hypothetical protein